MRPHLEDIVRALRDGAHSVGQDGDADSGFVVADARTGDGRQQGRAFSDRRIGVESGSVDGRRTSVFETKNEELWLPTHSASNAFHP